MAKTKTCSSCNELKSTTKFSKYKSAKDGLQPHCKECQSSRTRPITNKLLKADKDGVIYTITNPLGETYVGQTNKKPEYRFSNHISTYKFKKSNSYNTASLLYASFDQWGANAHIFEVIENYGNIDKESLREIESNMIKAYKLNGKSLNINN
jgi:hypothetical protein